MVKIFILIIFLISAIPQVFAEVLILKNGQHIEGTILENTEQTIKIDFKGVPITYDRTEIETIEKEIPAIIVQNEEEKQMVIDALVEEKAADRIYTLEKVEPQVPLPEEPDEDGVPRANQGVQFMSIEELNQKMKAEEAALTPPQLEERRQAEQRFTEFYDSR